MEVGAFVIVDDPFSVSGRVIDDVATGSALRRPVLRDTHGWSLDRIESWMADATRRLLLG